MVEIAHDARIREAVQLSFGRVLHPDEVAADKTLRCLAVPLRETWWMWRRCPSGTRSNG
jgi:hypothetical protein